jgi:hypothetical protein
MRQAQQTYGNKAVQRFLQRRKAEAAREGEGLEEKGSAQPQTDTDNAVVGDPVVAQRVPSLDTVEEGLDVDADMGEKAGADADGGGDVAMPSAPGRTPSPALALRDSMRATPIALSVQRDIKGSKNQKFGKFEIAFTKNEGAAVGDRAAEDGTVTFTPNLKAPASNSIRFVQIVRNIDVGGVTAAAGAVVDWSKVGTGSEAAINKQNTSAAKGVNPGFSVDQLPSLLHKRTKKSDAKVLPYYDAMLKNPGNQIGKRTGKTIVPAILDDHPGSTAAIRFSFETSAKASDTGLWYGSVLWGFETYLDKAGIAKIKGEHKDFKESPSATTSAALKKFNEYYRNPGSSTAPTK